MKKTPPLESGAPARWLPSRGEVLDIRVTPKASSNRLKIEMSETGTRLIRAYVTCVPEDGKANEAVLALLSKEFGYSKSSFEILQGKTSRNKLIKLRE